jgi:hypothetical protein
MTSASAVLWGIVNVTLKTSSPHAVRKKITTAGQQPSQRGQVTGSELPSKAVRSAGRSASLAREANGFRELVQLPARPHDNGIAIQVRSQNEVGSMFSESDCAPVNPTQTRNARMTSPMVPPIGWNVAWPGV